MIACLAFAKPFIEICNRNIRVDMNDVGMQKCV